MNEPIFSDVIKVLNGSFILPEYHIERISRTSEHFFSNPLRISLDDNIIPADMRQGSVKCRILYSKDIISITFYKYKIKNISSLKLVYDDNIDYSYKYKNRDELNRLLSNRQNQDEEILIIKHSFITDTSYTNVVFKSPNGELYTPDTFLLAGTKRQWLIDTNIIKPKRIGIEDIKSYSGVYLINSMIDIEDNIFVKTKNIK